MKNIWLYAALSLAASLFMPAVASAQQLTCESRNYQQEFCPTGMTITRAWLVAQRSRAPCIEGQTWGRQNNGIWVTQGCEGDFGFQGVGGPPVVVAPGRPGTGLITCESRNYQQQYCPTGQQIASAWVIEQRSAHPASRAARGDSRAVTSGSPRVAPPISASRAVAGRPWSSRRSQSTRRRWFARASTTSRISARPHGPSGARG